MRRSRNRGARRAGSRGTRSAPAGRRLAFPGPKGAPLRRSNLRCVWWKACSMAGLDGLVFHELRHTAAASQSPKGLTRSIKERLGHSSITVTMDRYGGLFPRLEEALAEGLDDVLRISLAGPLRDERGWSSICAGQRGKNTSFQAGGAGSIPVARSAGRRPFPRSSGVSDASHHPHAQASLASFRDLMRPG